MFGLEIIEARRRPRFHPNAQLTQASVVNHLASPGLILKKKIHGFTLIELLVGLLILGILAAVVLPKYLNLSSQARISAVKALAGSAASADAMIYSASLVRGWQSIVTSSYPTGAFNPGGSDSVRLWCGHPDIQWDGIGNTPIDADVTWGTGYNRPDTHTYGNFTFYILRPNIARWDYTTAPKPTSCSVVYDYNPVRNSPGVCNGDKPVITVITSGC
jgi:MSHA pilin protein MshA